MRPTAFLTLCALWLGGAAAATPRDDMTALIRAGDAGAVLAALAVADHAAQRQSFAAFQTSRPDAGEVSAALLEAYPDDARAMTARGWYLLSRGWALRGSGFADTVFADGLAQMDALHAEALALARAALEADPTLVPASDLLLSLARTTGQRSAIPAEFDRVMRVWPNRQSLILAVGGMTPSWGGPPGWGDEACAAWGGRIADVEGYTPEVCALDILWAAPYGYAAQVAAYDRLAASDHPILDAGRKQRLTSGRMPDAELIPALEAFLKQGKLSLQQADMLDGLKGEGGPGVTGPATRAVLRTEVPRLRAEVEFNPGDSFAVSRYVDALMREAWAEGTPVPRDEIHARFGALFRLAPYDGDAWARYGFLLQDGLDFQTVELARLDEIRGYMTNGVYFTNHTASQLAWLDAFNRQAWDSLDRRNIDAVDATGTTAFPKAEYEASVICPAIRTIRLLKAVCEANPGAQGCPGPESPLPWDEQIARAQKRGACAVELTADPRDLLYAPVAVRLPD